MMIGNPAAKTAINQKIFHLWIHRSLLKELSKFYADVYWLQTHSCNSQLERQKDPVMLEKMQEKLSWISVCL